MKILFLIHCFIFRMPLVLMHLIFFIILKYKGIEYHSDPCRATWGLPDYYSLQHRIQKHEQRRCPKYVPRPSIQDEHTSCYKLFKPKWYLNQITKNWMGFLKLHPKHLLKYGLILLRGEHAFMMELEGGERIIGKVEKASELVTKEWNLRLYTNMTCYATTPHISSSRH